MLWIAISTPRAKSIIAGLYVEAGGNMWPIGLGRVIGMRSTCSSCLGLMCCHAFVLMCRQHSWCIQFHCLCCFTMLISSNYVKIYFQLMVTILMSTLLIVYNVQKLRRPEMKHCLRRWYRAWTKFILLWAVYSSFFTPLEFGFFRGLPENLFILDIVGQVAFLLDIILQFFIAYRDSQTYRTVYKRAPIALRSVLSSSMNINLVVHIVSLLLFSEIHQFHCLSRYKPTAFFLAWFGSASLAYFANLCHLSLFSGIWNLILSLICLPACLGISSTRY